MNGSRNVIVEIQTPASQRIDTEAKEAQALETQSTASLWLRFNSITLEEQSQKVSQRDPNASEKNESCSHQLSDSHQKKACGEKDQETFDLQTAIITLQTELHEVKEEADTLLKDSKKHVAQMEKMLCTLGELQHMKKSAYQKLQEAEDEALLLHNKVRLLEQSLKNFYQSVNETKCEHATGNQQILVTINEKTIKDSGKELRGYPTKEQQWREQHNRFGKQERMSDLIMSIGQEMALLTKRLSSSKDSGVTLSVKLELLQKLAESQTTQHQSQTSELESSLYTYKEKVFYLEQKIHEAQTQLSNAKKERDLSIQEAKNLRLELKQLKQQLEHQEDSKTLKEQLEVFKEQLCKVLEEKNFLETVLEGKTEEMRKSKEMLQEKEQEINLRKDQAQQHLISLDDARSQCQILKAEREKLKLKVTDQEKNLAVLQLRIESSIQMTAQHSHTIDGLQQENSLLIKQLNQHKLEILQLRAESVQLKSDLLSVERERRQLEDSVTEQSQRVREETLEKEQVTVQLELQRVQYISLTKEHKELLSLHRCRNEEQEGVVLKLQSQLCKAHEELDKIRQTLRTLEGVDRHGFQVAVDLQRVITDKREEIDSLQGRIQHLEEKVEKLQQEKRSQTLETHHQLQELTFVREEKRQLASELKGLRSKDQHLKERINELEAILHKMAEGFANCQDFLQLKEQEYIRLKLQHSLDLRVLQGQHFFTLPTVSPPDLNPETPSAQTTPPSTQHACNTHIMENPTSELSSLVKELQAVISENHRPHTDKSAAGSGSQRRRRSAPEMEHRNTCAKNNKASGLRRKTCGSEPHVLKTSLAKLNRESCFCSSPRTASKPDTLNQILSLGRRSPVHLLLTADPNS